MYILLDEAFKTENSNPIYLDKLINILCKYFDCNFGDICDAVKIEETEKKQEEVS